MRKFFIALLFIAPFAVAGMSLSPGVGVHTHSDDNTGGATLGAHSVTGALASTKACAAGYTRLTPNFCTRNARTISNTALTRDTCTSVTVPAGATGILVRIHNWIGSNNAIAPRNVYVRAYNEATCNVANQFDLVTFDLREFAAVVAATVIGSTTTHIVVPAPVWFQFADDAGNQGQAFFDIQGYFD